MSSDVAIHGLQSQIGLACGEPSSEKVSQSSFIGFLNERYGRNNDFTKQTVILADKWDTPSVMNVLNIGVTNLLVDPKRTNNSMTQYKIELYRKGAREPYEIFMADLGTRGFHPRFTSTQECFGGKLEKADRVKVYYASNGSLAAVKTYDRRTGQGRLSWRKLNRR